MEELPFRSEDPEGFEVEEEGETPSSCQHGGYTPADRFRNHTPDSFIAETCRHCGEDIEHLRLI